MASLMVIGAAPLPFENQKKNYALNNRTWHICQALSEERHTITLVGARARGAYDDETVRPRVNRETIGPNLVYWSVDRDSFGQRFLRRLYRSCHPDGLVGVGTVASACAVRLPTDRPIWADLFGSLMAEAQAKAYVYQDDFYLRYWRPLETRILRRADAFSVVSTPQKYALVGELGLAGRLNRHTLGYDFVRVMPICVDEAPLVHGNTLLRSGLVKEDDFVVFWSGGYNTWTDVDTLFSGLVRAMKKNRKIRFVSSGGAIATHDELTFRRFTEKIRASEFSDRFVFLGWIPTEDVPGCYRESDVGINIDKFSYEALLGARNRVTEMIRAGLPVLTTKVSEISALVERENLGLVFPVGQAEALAEAILALAENPDRLKKIRERLAEFPMAEFSYNRIMEPLKEWARQPYRAPDYGKRLITADIPALRRVQFLVRQGSQVFRNRGAKEACRQALEHLRGRLRHQK